MSRYDKGIRTPLSTSQRFLNSLPCAFCAGYRYPRRPHTHFIALEDLYGLTIGEFDGRTYLYLNRGAPEWFRNALITWKIEGQMFHNDEITRDEYNTWRYNYPEYVDKPIPYAIKPEEIRAR